MSTLYSLVSETSPKHALLRDAALVVLSSFLIGLFAHVSIPLPFTPVPIATQSLFVLLLSVLLGPKRGAAAVLLFLCQGAAGLPVFAGGAAGLAKLAGPTGGYLIGYMAAAYITGALAERKRTLLNASIAMTAGSAAIYLLGASYLATFVGLQKALLLGVVPFLLGDALKILASLRILRFLKWA